MVHYPSALNRPRTSQALGAFLWLARWTGKECCVTTLECHLFYATAGVIFDMFCYVMRTGIYSPELMQEPMKVIVGLLALVPLGGCACLEQLVITAVLDLFAFVIVENKPVLPCVLLRRQAYL